MYTAQYILPSIFIISYILLVFILVSKSAGDVMCSVLLIIESILAIFEVDFANSKECDLYKHRFYNYILDVYGILLQFSANLV